MSEGAFEDCFRDRVAYAERDGQNDVVSAFRRLDRTLPDVPQRSWDLLEAAYRSAGKDAVGIELDHLKQVGRPYSPVAPDFILDLIMKLERPIFIEDGDTPTPEPVFIEA